MHETRLSTAGPFDGEGVLRYLAGHAIPGVEFADAKRYRRVVRLDSGGHTSLLVRLDGPEGIKVLIDEPAPKVPIPDEPVPAAPVPGSPDPKDVLARVRQLANLDADSTTIDAHLSADAALAQRVQANPGIRVPGTLDPQEQLFRTLIGQQISISAARTVLGALVKKLCGESGQFPTAEQIAARGQEVLRGPKARIATILTVAQALASGELTISRSHNVEELTERLTAFAGIGPWTAGYVAMRVLGAPDVLLSTDTVLLKGAAALGLPSTPRGIADYGQRWAPYRSYAGLHLWRAAQSSR
ncbi:MAG: AlkA N-terminal domain-containing protein [Terrimesophilobacter sp.]